jgi:hypothetical protein
LPSCRWRRDHRRRDPVESDPPGRVRLHNPALICSDRNDWDGGCR